jgi:hypothetical protein
MTQKLESDESRIVMGLRTEPPYRGPEGASFSGQRSARRRTIVMPSKLLITTAIVLALQFPAPARSGPAGDKKSDLPQGFEIFLKVPEADVMKAVKAVTENDTIQGTLVYEHEKELTDAVPETSSAYYGEWKGEGHAFYKVRRDALAPRNFKDSTDIGVITVRYIVQGIDPNKTRLQIDAVFVEDGNHKVHASDTTVETSEFVEVQAHIADIQKEEQKNAELTQKRQMMVQARNASKERDDEIARLNVSENSVASLQQKIDELHRKLEVRVKADPIELKAAPFDRAAKLNSLPSRAELLVEIITDYWYGVETVQGQRGWVRQDQVEALP